MHHWKWSEEAQFPPLTYVLQAPVWSWEEYDTLREKLKLAVPTPKVLDSENSGYLTIESSSRAVEEGGGPSSSDRYEMFV